MRSLAGQPFEFEGVWRRDRGRRQGAVAKEFGDARGHVTPTPDVADHRIARIGRVGIGRAQAFKRPQSRLSDLRLAEIAGQSPAQRESTPIACNPLTQSSIIAASKARPRQPA